MKKNLLICLIALVALIGVIAAVGRFWLVTKDDVEIIFREEDSVPGQRLLYTLKGGIAEGDLSLLPEADPAKAQSIVDAQIMGVRSSFENRLVPYGGQITSSFDCEAKKYLREEIIPFAGADTKLVLAVASDRKVFGVCSAGQIKYAAAFWAGYDGKKGRVINIGLFWPVITPNEIEKSQQEVSSIARRLILSERY